MAGVEDQQVEPATQLDGDVDQGLAVAGVGDVAGQGAHRTGPAELGGGPVQLVGGAGVDDHVPAVADQAAGQGQAQSS